MSERTTNEVREPAASFDRPSRQAPLSAAHALGAGLKVPPHSVEAEQAVLGGLMLDNTAWDNVAEVLQAVDFYRHEHQLIFDVMQRHAEASKPIDVVTLVEALDSLNQVQDAGGIEYLSDLASHARGTANISAYARIIRERATLRTLISVSNEIADNAFNPAGREAADVLDFAEQKVFQIADSRARDGGPQPVNYRAVHGLQGSGQKNLWLAEIRPDYCGRPSFHGQNHLCHESGRARGDDPGQACVGVQPGNAR
jgi:hypothetical protein